jgi:phospholipid/cholesterol/gamma-HCH transport system substrate-binding protein
MLVNIHHDTAAEHRRLLVYGVVFVAVLAALVGTSIAIYQKVFQPVTMVTIKAQNAGLQLSQFGDVRVHGVLVGQVRSIDQEADEASIRVGLFPEAAESIPENVSVQILPTTLFGQKYISLVDPEVPSDQPLGDGDVIPADRVDTNVELSRILADLFPLLRSVRPADLNATLNALATALGGRGERIGATLERLDSYVTAIGDHLPTLRKDLVALAEVARTYDIAAPDLVRMLRNLTVTGRTVYEKRSEVESFFSDVAGVSRTGSRVLRTNEENLIRLGELSRPALALLDTYAPEYPCLFKGIDRYSKNLGEIFEGDTIRQMLELGASQKEPYDKGDRPVYGETGRGPLCHGLPFPQVPTDPFPLRDGSDNDDDPSQSPVPGGQPDPGLSLVASGGVTSGYAGTRAEQTVINSVLAARTGRPVDSFASMPSLLYGPLLRGTEVSG